MGSLIEILVFSKDSITSRNRCQSLCDGSTSRRTDFLKENMDDLPSSQRPFASALLDITMVSRCFSRRWDIPIVGLSNFESIGANLQRSHESRQFCSVPWQRSIGVVVRRWFRSHLGFSIHQLLAIDFSRMCLTVQPTLRLARDSRCSARQSGYSTLLNDQWRQAPRSTASSHTRRSMHSSRSMCKSNGVSSREWQSRPTDARVAIEEAERNEQ
jgi:hypothetical protein